MKRLIYLLPLLFIPFVSKGQLVVSDPTAASLQAKSNVIQAAVHTLTQTSVEKLGDLGKLTQDLYQVTKDYQDELQLVSSFVASTAAVKEIFAIQEKTVKAYATDVMKYDKNLTAQQKTIYRKGMKRAVSRSLDYLSDLDVVITSNFTKMSDGERMNLINQVKDKMEKNYSSIVSLSLYFKRLYNLVEINNQTYNYIK